MIRPLIRRCVPEQPPELVHSRSELQRDGQHACPPYPLAGVVPPPGGATMVVEARAARRPAELARARARSTRQAAPDRRRGAGRCVRHRVRRRRARPRRSPADRHRRRRCRDCRARGSAADASRRQASDVRVGQVGDVDVVADAGAVGRRVVVAEDRQRPSAGAPRDRQRNQMFLRMSGLRRSAPSGPRRRR